MPTVTAYFHYQDGGERIEYRLTRWFFREIKEDLKIDGEINPDLCALDSDAAFIKEQYFDTDGRELRKVWDVNNHKYVYKEIANG